MYMYSLGPRPSPFLICGGGDNAVGLTDHVTVDGVDTVTKNMRNMRLNASVTDRQ